MPPLNVHPFLLTRPDPSTFIQQACPSILQDFDPACVFTPVLSVCRYEELEQQLVMARTQAEAAEEDAELVGARER